MSMSGDGASVNDNRPLRTCVVTRAKRPQDELLRCVAQASPDGTMKIVPDPDRVKPGRGAWITPTLSVWEAAVKRRAFARALKLSTTVVDADPVRVHLEQKETDH
ncbi:MULTISPECIES: YlxR family protein [unclassified Corynebacterium]|nr:YlxR family protein [Corynebacterium sp. zg254]